MSRRALPVGPGTYPQSRSNGMAVAGLVCGIIGLFLFAIILGPLAIVFGGVGLSRARRGASGSGMARAAVILGIVDVVLFVALVAFTSTHGGFYVHG